MRLWLSVEIQSNRNGKSVLTLRLDGSVYEVSNLVGRHLINRLLTYHSLDKFDTKRWMTVEAVLGPKVKYIKDFL